MDKDLVCNFKKCRKSLTSTAWVTSCSHIFCNEDGSREFQHDLVCPACKASLPGKFDILRIDLQPSEQYKSTQQEIAYLDYAYTKSKERTQQLEQYYGQVVDRTQTEISSLKTQVSGLQKELEETKKNYNEVSDKLMEKKRQYQKLLSNYDMQRRKCITPLIDSDQSLSSTPSLRARGLQSPPLPHHTFQMPMGHRDDNFPGNAGEPSRPPVRNYRAMMRQPSNVDASGSENFVLRPMKSPIDNL